MGKFFKYFAGAFFGQVCLIVVLIILLELTNIELFWHILRFLYVSPADSLITFLSGAQKTDSGSIIFVSGMVPVLGYSTIVAILIALRRKLKSD